MLAQVAAVLRIVGEALNLQLLGLDDKMTDALFFAEGLGLVQLPLRKGAAARRDGNGVIAQGVMGNL